ncbi:hypothetical protein HDU97_004392 [Phlyctochytrium planicorne]|nr:hypothetical protein HDU97_004392 [Phlyctochytrium planicorne]
MHHSSYMDGPMGLIPNESFQQWQTMLTSMKNEVRQHESSFQQTAGPSVAFQNAQLEMPQVRVVPSVHNFTTSTLAAFTPSTLAAFTPVTISNFTPATLANFTTSTLANFTPPTTAIPSSGALTFATGPSMIAGDMDQSFESLLLHPSPAFSSPSPQMQDPFNIHQQTLNAASALSTPAFPTPSPRFKSPVPEDLAAALEPYGSPSIHGFKEATRRSPPASSSSSSSSTTTTTRPSSSRTSRKSPSFEQGGPILKRATVKSGLVIGRPRGRPRKRPSPKTQASTSIGFVNVLFDMPAHDGETPVHREVLEQQEEEP